MAAGYTKSEGLTKEELNEIIPLIIAGDQEKFAIFYEAYDGCVRDVAGRWVRRLETVTRGMMTLEDVVSEIWSRVWEVIPKYDSTQSKMSTYIYLVGKQRADRVWRYHSTKLRCPGDSYVVHSMDLELGEKGDSSLYDLIEDPFNAISNFESEAELFFQLYTLKRFIASMNHVHQMIYLHQVKNLTLQASGEIVSLTRERVRQIRKMLMKKQENFLSKIERVTIKESTDFGMDLLSDIDDEELCDLKGYDLAVVKICREALQEANLYCREPRKECIA